MTLKAETIGEDCQTRIWTYQNFFYTYKQKGNSSCMPNNVFESPFLDVWGDRTNKP